jgi:hypothetical protein
MAGTKRLTDAERKKRIAEVVGLALSQHERAQAVDVHAPR